MKVHTLIRKQTLNTDIDQAWEFFSSPENLDLLTPKNMGFKITTPRPLPKMFQGQLIDYKVAPLLGIPLKWKTKITEVKNHEYFVDEQLKGPYKYWRHLHTFKTVDGKILMGDHLEYALPMGFLGSIAQALYVKNRIEEIFDYRYEKVDSIFNQKDLAIAKKLSDLSEAPPTKPPSTSVLVKSS